MRRGARPSERVRVGIARLAGLFAALAVASGCGTPIGVVRGDPQTMFRSLTASVVSTGEASAATQQTLRRLGLAQRFEEEPEATLAVLRGSGRELSRNRLFTLAELCFLHGERTAKREYYLTAAVYAYAFLRASDAPGTGLDPRTRLAADLYNLGVSLGLQSAAGDEVVLTDRTLPLAFGELELRADPAGFLWGGYRMTRFVPVAEYEVRGLRNRYRQPGIGAALAAEVAPAEAGPEAAAQRRRIPPRIKIPVTAFVRIDDVLEGIAGGRVRARLELFSADATATVEVDDHKLPLQLEPTAALAYMLEGAPVWDSELAGFLSAERPVFGDGLIMLHPYRPGRVPVVLIHGTASSPARWAEMVNELQNDVVLRDRIQFWLFTYNTSNPVLLSAKQLRDALRHALQDFDAAGRDPALRQMVLIGHSQGGLLTRLMVTDSGSRFWDIASRVPPAEMKVSPAARELLEGSLIFEPLPFVREVVFIATPHRGSFRVSDFVIGLVRRFVTLPITVLTALGEAVAQNPDVMAPALLHGVPTAVDNMRPDHPFIRTLSSSPIAGGVGVHSIVAVQGEGPPGGQTDGVVAYESAHLDGVASEKIVHSSHSTQGHPETILEVRRILREVVTGR